MDAGVSATKVPFEERPYLQKLIGDAADKKFDCIIVYKTIVLQDTLKSMINFENKCLK